MRALALHADVLVASSAVLQVNCVIVRGVLAGEAERESMVASAQSGVLGDDAEEQGKLASAEDVIDQGPAAEVFVIDSPILPDELNTLPALLAQTRFPAPSGLLATHGDWDHLLGRLAFPAVALGCAESTAQRLEASPGEAQRELRAFDRGLLIERPRPLALGSLQALPVPGRCGIGDFELELHPAEGHTTDGMAVWIPWARVLVAGDYLSTVEAPDISEDSSLAAYLATLERLRPLVALAEHVVPGHGPVLEGERALEVLEENLATLTQAR